MVRTQLYHRIYKSRTLGLVKLKWPAAQRIYILIIGLTGGIASGKSTAAKLLGTWGAYVIDADKLGHRAYLKDTEAFRQVVATFGEDVVGADGEVDRGQLGNKVFGGENRMAELTAIVWPAIRQMAQTEIDSALAEAPERVVVLEAAVLIEAGWQDIADQVWVVVVEPATAIERAQERDGVEAPAVQARIDAQLTNQERTKQANQVIDNSADIQAMEATLQALWQNLSGAQS